MVFRRLSTRQAEVLRQLSAGKSLREIAHARGVTLGAITSLRNGILRRFPRTPLAEICRMAAADEPPAPVPEPAPPAPDGRGVPFGCRRCRAELGRVRPGQVLHPDPTAATLVFVDLRRGVATFRCTQCREWVPYSRGRISVDLEDLPTDANLSS